MAATRGTPQLLSCSCSATSATLESNNASASLVLGLTLRLSFAELLAAADAGANQNGGLDAWRMSSNAAAVKAQTTVSTSGGYNFTAGSASTAMPAQAPVSPKTSRWKDLALQPGSPTSELTLRSPIAGGQQQLGSPYGSPSRAAAPSLADRRAASQFAGQSLADVMSPKKGSPMSALVDTKGQEPIATSAVALKGHKGIVTSAQWSPTEPSSLVSGSADGTAWIWRLKEEGKWESLSRLSGHEGWVLDVAWSPDGEKVLTVSDDCTARIWGPDASDEEGNEWVEIAKIEPGDDMIRAVDWSPNGNMVALGMANHNTLIYKGGDDSWDQFSTLHGHTAMVLSVRWSPDGGSVATGSCDRTGKVWRCSDLDENDPSWQCQQLGGTMGFIKSTDFDSSGLGLLVAYGDKTAKIWRMDPEEDIWHLEYVLRGHEKGVSAVAWHKNDKLILTGDDLCTVRLWQRVEGDPSSQWDLRSVLPGHRGSISGLGWNTDGVCFLTASEDKTIRVWKHTDLS
eukprot:TRINITY_DN37102_c0_g1_i1.p1 TRINITY_DN37102_c0_g1~~TRINITY_DN37102_c0_g1_i1.p1  ORF type:complete len:532 (-),score=120.18 TRINITY_DN37102_c0_g1_i1:156-1691(-)